MNQILTVNYTTASNGNATPKSMQSKEDPNQINTRLIAQMLLHDNLETRNKVAELVKDPLFTPVYDLKMAEYRQLNFERMKKVAQSGVLQIQEIIRNPLSMIAVQEMLAYIDINLCVKTSVHFGLFGGAILNLGTEKHHKYFQAIESLELPGCFALTELGHGSNARGIETTATYHKPTDQFIINTPTELAQKYWIGNVACHGKIAAVYANLIVEGKDQGPHALLVRIRDDSGNTMPGITIADCGVKMGLNGVDNGRLWFDNVAVPRDNLLDKYGRVNDQGKYETSITHPGVRFNTSIDALVGGRVAVGAMAISLSKLGLLIATRYSISRKQFGPPKKGEIPIMDYLSHQRRLLIPLATSIGLQLGINYTKDRFSKRSEKDKRDVFLLASGFKAVCTTHKAQALQYARECCGGQGFGAHSRIGIIRADSDVDLTYEGDNTVLLQAVAKALLQEFMTYWSGEKRITTMIGYLKDQFGVMLRNKNFIAKHSTTDLRNLELFHDAYIYREFKLLRLMVNKLRHKTKVEHKEPLEAWNECLEMALALGRTYVERVTIEKYIEAINSITHAPTKHLMEQLCCLYALSKLEQDMSWFLTYKFFAPTKSKAITAEVNKLCAELRPYAYQITECLGIPDHMIHSSLASNWQDESRRELVLKSKL